MIEAGITELYAFHYGRRGRRGRGLSVLPALNGLRYVEFTFQQRATTITPRTRCAQGGNIEIADAAG